MQNYQAVHQWVSTVNVDGAVNEIRSLKLKYPWLKCDEVVSALEKMQKDLPNIVRIIKLQEKQNLIHRNHIEVNRIADEAIVKAIQTQYDL